jgi:guanine deaminase
LDWLQTYTFPMEASLGNPDSPAYANFSGVPDPYARAVQVYTDVVQRTLAYGTTTASYFATIDVPATNLLAKLAFTLGQRAFVGRVCMDDPEYTPDYYRDESAEEAMNATWANIDYIRALDPAGDLVAPIVTPRFAPAVTPDTLTWLGQLAADENLRVQTHIAENVREVALVADMFPDQPSYAAVYDAHGLLTNRTILAHGVHLTDDEMGLIAARGAKVSHCPASNSALGSGICPTRKLLDMGVEVGLGTDLAGGYSASVLEVARQAFLVSRLLSQQNGGDSTLTISVAESLYLATVGGAQVVSMPGLLGAFEPGMRWDVQEIVFANDAANLDTDADAVELFDWESWSQRAQKWFWHGDDRNVHRVWVGGRLVHQKPQ